MCKKSSFGNVHKVIGSFYLLSGATITFCLLFNAVWMQGIGTVPNRLLFELYQHSYLVGGPLFVLAGVFLLMRDWIWDPTLKPGPVGSIVSRSFNWEQGQSRLQRRLLQIGTCAAIGIPPLNLVFVILYTRHLLNVLNPHT